jgi:hypothetical protein
MKRLNVPGRKWLAAGATCFSPLLYAFSRALDPICLRSSLRTRRPPSSSVWPVASSDTPLSSIIVVPVPSYCLTSHFVRQPFEYPVCVLILARSYTLNPAFARQGARLRSLLDRGHRGWPDQALCVPVPSSDAPLNWIMDVTHMRTIAQRTGTSFSTSCRRAVSFSGQLSGRARTHASPALDAMR